MRIHNSTSPLARRSFIGRLGAVLGLGLPAVCQMASRGLAGSIAGSTGGNTDAVYNELVANVLTNSHMAPAGIVAVNRAQERGYSFVHA